MLSLSLDPPKAGLQEPPVRDDSSVSDFHDVFQRVKRDNPTASVGALRQMTMARYAEDKARREEEERRRR
ncbi:hypothetical protein ACHAWF_003404, partial [Thalassiosira exigua]